MYTEIAQMKSEYFGRRNAILKQAVKPNNYQVFMDSILKLHGDNHRQYMYETLCAEAVTLPDELMKDYPRGIRFDYLESSPLELEVVRILEQYIQEELMDTEKYPFVNLAVDNLPFGYKCLQLEYTKLIYIIAGCEPKTGGLAALIEL